MSYLIISKPILIALHLGFAIIGIDAFIWLLGEYIAQTAHFRRMLWTAIIGNVGFLLSWLFGGFYYVKFYGSSVKPIINAGLAPWAHAIFMETKEHIFLFLPPMALTVLFIVLTKNQNIRRSSMWLVGLIAAIGLALGGMGFIISAAARWGVIN
jgi:hypothetical protein